MSLRGKRVWLIGASAGIGAATARKLASEGAIVALSARDEAALVALQAELSGVGHVVARADVTSRESLAGALEEIREHWPQVDVVMYNAGVYTPMNVDNFNLGAALNMVDINFRGAFFLLDLILPLFAAQKSGHLALVASVAAYRGLPNALGYSASKAGLLNLAESLYVELKPKGVKVQVISPGFVKTRLTDINQFKMPFITTPERAAEAIVFGLQTDAFEIHFPKRFTYIMKLIQWLPDVVYLRLARFFN